MRPLTFVCALAITLFSNVGRTQDCNCSGTKSGSSLTKFVKGLAESDCSEALVMATFKSWDENHVDWRLAQYVSESTYNQIKQEYGLSVVIYGVPIGASYKNFNEKARAKAEQYEETLTQHQFSTILWTGLDPNAYNAYAKCLDTQIFSQPGLHLDVQGATKSQVSLLIVWTPIGSLATAAPQWSWSGADAGKLPDTIPAGRTTAVLTRPQESQLLAGNFNGYTDSITIEPFPPPPTTHPIEYIETAEMYESPAQVSWSTRWSSPHALCTPDKPEGWEIVRVYDFHIETTTPPRGCGAWATCSGAETDTPKRACRITSVQGFDDNQYAGYGRIKSVFHVLWRHPK